MDTLDLNGQQFALGCQVPKTRPLTFNAYADSAPILSKDQIAEIVNDPSRKWGVVIAGAKIGSTIRGK